MGATALKQIIFNIPKHYSLELDEIAEKHGVPVSELCGMVVQTFISNHLKAGSPNMILPAEKRMVIR